ncbi:MAG: hypothetical protein IPK63_15270 [Candidatus Competibacteraceae bacterium]|nr:hypothetical protein [Candidatus Competibacteraceae bacterium]
MFLNQHHNASIDRGFMIGLPIAPPWHLQFLCKSCFYSSIVRTMAAFSIFYFLDQLPLSMASASEVLLAKGNMPLFLRAHIAMAGLSGQASGYGWILCRPGFQEQFEEWCGK